jgi:hypothetical protein
VNPEPAQVTAVVRTAFGSDTAVRAVQRLRGGTKKGVYRLTLGDESTVVLYVWTEDENYWPAQENRENDPADPFAEASGLDLFRAAAARLTALGIRTPVVHLTDTSGTHYPGDVALVEDVRGGTLEALLRTDPDRAQPVLAELADMLKVMAGAGSDRFGRVGTVDGGLPVTGLSCEQVVLDRALGHLAEAAARVERIGAARERVEDELRGLAADVRPRVRHGVVHGELGPDHVMVDARGHPVLIDIEGTLYFDVEWEHAFLRMRFDEHYRSFDTSGLDEQRLRLYELAMHISLVAGPLRLLDGDFPDRAFMLQIIEDHSRPLLHPHG